MVLLLMEVSLVKMLSAVVLLVEVMLEVVTRRGAMAEGGGDARGVDAKGGADRDGDTLGGSAFSGDLFPGKTVWRKYVGLSCVSRIWAR